MGAKGSHPAGAHPGIEAAERPRSPGLAPSQRGLGGAVPRVGWGTRWLGFVFSRREPYPSSINACAFIVGLAAEFTIIPISQSDKLRRGGAALASCPRSP